MLKVRRLIAITGQYRAFSFSRCCAKERLVILGSGWGGYEVLRGVNKKYWDVTVVSPNNYFNFTPLLASCAVGTLQFGCAIEPVRKYAPKIVAYQAWCDKVDFKRKAIKCMPATPPVLGSSSHQHFALSYDKLVIAVGAYSQTFDIPGVKEHANFLKDVKDARAIRSRILECLEQANQPTLSDVDRRQLLHFCIVGAGPTGVEFAAELHDFMHDEVASHFPTLARMARISLYDVAPQILGSFDQSLVKYTEKSLRREGINIFTSHHVLRVEPGKLVVKEKGEVPFGLLVWSTGLSPNPLIAATIEISKNTNMSRSFLTNEHLNVLYKDGTPDPEVFAVGDCANIKGNRLPATAQVANQKGRYVVKKLNKMVKDQTVIEPFEFKNLGSLAYVGNWKAIYDPPNNKEVMMQSGRTAWLVWRSAYFTMTLSLRNKILVPFYWFLNWIFGRDLSRF